MLLLCHSKYSVYFLFFNVSCKIRGHCKSSGKYREAQIMKVSNPTPTFYPELSIAIILAYFLLGF